MRKRVMLGVASVALILSGHAATPVGESESAAAAAARKSNYKEIGGAFKTINDEIRSGFPDMNAVLPAARDLASRAAITLQLFPPGSGPGPGIETRAKPEIWANQPAFTKLQNEMVAAANDLNKAVAGGKVPAMEKARDALGATCKACHDRFRQRT